MSADYIQEKKEYRGIAQIGSQTSCRAQRQLSGRKDPTTRIGTGQLGFATEKIAVFAPIPSATVSTRMAVEELRYGMRMFRPFPFRKGNPLSCPSGRTASFVDERTRRPCLIGNYQPQGAIRFDDVGDIDFMKRRFA